MMQRTQTELEQGERDVACVGAAEEGGIKKLFLRTRSKMMNLVKLCLMNVLSMLGTTSPP